MLATGKVGKVERRSKSFCRLTDGVLIAITTTVTLSATQSGSSVSDRYRVPLSNKSHHSLQIVLEAMRVLPLCPTSDL